MVNEILLSNNLQAEMLDLDLSEVVNEALHSLDSVRETSLALQVNVLDEVVTVSGVVLSRIMRQAVLQTFSRVPGVRDVIRLLYTDTDLAAAVSEHDSRQRGQARVAKSKEHLRMADVSVLSDAVRRDHPACWEGAGAVGLMVHAYVSMK